MKLCRVLKLKRSLLPIINFLLLSLSVLAQVNTKGAELLSTGQGEFNNVRAVIVGISKYINIDTLSFADKDAIAFRDYLCSRAGGSIDRDNVKLLTDEEATIGRILPEIKWLVDESEEGDLAIFYFSGHGDVMSEVNEPYLLTVETPRIDYSISAIDMVKLSSRLALITKKNAHVILIIDACRSGNLSGGKKGAKDLTEAVLKWEYTNRILSCQPNELSQESSKWGDGAGVFTYYLLLGLKGLADANNDKLVNLEELENYLERNVKAETKGDQYPAVIGEWNTILAKVDSVTFASLKSESTTGGDVKQVAWKGTETTLAALDTLTKDLIKKFKVCLKNGVLIDSTQTYYALGIYNELKNREDINTVELKTMLLASLQDKSQFVVNSFLQGRSEEADTINLFEARKEINLALSLIDENHILYDVIKPKSLFMESIFYSLNEYDQRIKLLTECISIEPDAAYAYCELGSTYKDAKKIEEAISAYNKAINLSPKWNYPYYNLALTYQDSGEKDKAIENYKKAIEVDPLYSQAYYNLAIVYNNIGKTNLAIENYTKVIEIKPEFTDAYNNLGLIYYNSGDLTRAIEYFNKALSTNPNYKLAYYNLGIAYSDLGQIENAVENYNKTIELDSNYTDAYYNLGLIYYNNDDYSQAIKYYSSVVESDQYYILAYYNLGVTYYDLKQYEKAIHNFKKVIELDSNYVAAYNYLGVNYYKSGDRLQAIEYYKKTVQIDPSYKLGFYNLGMFYYELKEYDQSIENFQKATEIDPGYTDAYNYLGIIYFEVDDKTKSIDYFNKVLTVDLNYIMAYYNLGLVYSEMGDQEKAITNFLKTIELDSKFVYAYERLGLIYYQRKDFNSGINIYHKYIEFYPDDYNGYQMRGLCYFYDGNYELALADLNKAIELNPEDPGGYYNLACFYSVTNKADESLANLEKALQFGYNDFEHIEIDSDLDGIRSNPDFNKLIEKYKN